jgi:hypothetical protein
MPFSRLKPSSVLFPAPAACPLATFARLGACAALGALSFGCTSSAPTPSGSSGIVTSDDPQAFACFRNWTSTPGVGPPGAPDPSGETDGGIHSGPLTTYINKPPPHGSTSFPVGTIIVKEQSNPAIALTDRQIFAMVKRGDGYNTPPGQTVPLNWEFFELQNIDTCNVNVVWAGFPLAADPYAANPFVCDECHEGAKSNDYVWTVGLTLSSF